MSVKSKKAAPEKKILLGRPSNNLAMGIVGLPNVGKSTLFNVLTKLAVPASNFPFCTIEPNEARINVPDDRYDWLVQHFKPASKVPANLKITDIAGLIRGASQGEGLGNAFLSHIRAVDGIYHVLRIFEDEDITHVEGSTDPIRDIEIVRDELIIKDLEWTNQKLEKLEKEAKQLKKSPERDFQIEVMKKVVEMLDEKKEIRFGTWKANEVEFLNTLQLLTAKSVVYLLNMSQEDFKKKKSKWIPKLKQWVDEHGAEPIVPFCGSLESELLLVEESEREKFCKENNVQSSVGKITTVGYKALSLIHFFTCGADEVKCWTVRQFTKAPEAAGTIHTDFQKGFVCAEVMKFDDYKALGSESAVKSAGKWKQEGKLYEVQDGDMIFFKANTAGLKKKG